MDTENKRPRRAKAARELTLEADSDRLIRLDELLWLCGGISRPMLNQLEKRDPSFPRRRTIGGRTNVWSLRAVQAYIANLPAGIRRKSRVVANGALIQDGRVEL